MQVREPTDGTTNVPGWFTVAEAAKLLGTSAAAIYSRLYRGSYEVRRAGRTLLLSETTVMKLFTDVRQYQYHDR